MAHWRHLVNTIEPSVCGDDFKVVVVLCLQMADAMTDENRKCSTAQSQDTGTSKRVTSKSFKSFFRRKKKPPRLREHCMSVDEPEYQPRHHAGHYHTVSGTGSLGHVMHDQFSRRHLRRAHAGQIHVRYPADSVSEEDDDDVTHRPDMLSLIHI